MKYLLLLIGTLLFATLTTSRTDAQDNSLSIVAEAEDKAFDEAAGKSITVRVVGEYPGYTYMLYDKEPWKGATPLQSVKDSEDTVHTFPGLKSGIYYVCVMDAKENLDCRKVEIAGR